MTECVLAIDLGTGGPKVALVTADGTTVAWRSRPVHTTILMNARTGAARGLENGDIVQLESPYGHIFGKISLSQGVHPETVAVRTAFALTRTLGDFQQVLEKWYPKCNF